MDNNLPAVKRQMFIRLDKQTIPPTIAVRGLGRGVGTTTITANLALMLARAGRKTLALDLCLWNCGLTALFGTPPDSSLQELGKLSESGDLDQDSLRSRLRACRPFLDVLPGMTGWLTNCELQESNSWDFISQLLLNAKQDYQWVIADLGSHDSYRAPELHKSDKTENYVFFQACAAHLAILDSATWVVNVFGSRVSFEIWANVRPETSPRDLYVVNQSNPPGLFDPLNVSDSILGSTVYVPTFETSKPVDPLIVDAKPSTGQRRALGELKKLIAKMSR